MGLRPIHIVKEHLKYPLIRSRRFEPLSFPCKGDDPKTVAEIIT